MRERRFTKNYWAGREPLGKSFWRVYAHAVLINFIFFGFVLLLTVMATHASFPGAIYFLAWIIVANPYFIYCWVSVWRASATAGRGAWPIVAKAVVATHALLALVVSATYLHWALR